MERELVIGRIIREAAEQQMVAVDRKVALPTGTKKAITVIGPRRCGKTTLLISHFSRLAGAKIFFPLDDDRIYPPAIKDLDTALNVARELYPQSPKPYLFFDEIQEVPQWELFVKRAVEKESAGVYLTGSSSRLLSKEIATQLRGRTLTYELFPFSFREILNARGIAVEKFLTTSEESRIKALAKEYLTMGGFPEVVLKEEKKKILEEYANSMFYRDFVERHRIKNMKVARVFFNLLFNSFAKEVSVNKLFHFMKAQGMRTNKNMLYNYLEYLHDAYLIFPLRKFSLSLREREQSIPKLYAIDNGLVGMFSTDFQESMGRLMENTVFLELRKDGLVENNDIFYYRSVDGKETDFVIKTGRTVSQLIQVCYDVSDIATKEREVKGLLKASEDLRCHSLLVITGEYDGEEKVNGKKIAFVPLWKWLLRQ